MNLLIDIGNTATKIALSDHDQWVLAPQYTTLDRPVVQQLCSTYSVSQIVISQVGHTPELSQWLPSGIPCHTVTPHDKFPFDLAYNKPDTLGVDRVMVVLGALSLTAAPLLVIDAGTCITLDYLDDSNTYRGGAIMPGIQIKLQALHTFTAKLPLVQIEEKDCYPLVGCTTKECIESGVLNATALALQGFINQYQQLTTQCLTVFLTGGDADLLYRILHAEVSLRKDDMLLFRGLNEIAKRNEK